MQVGLVLGHDQSTVKHPSLERQKLLIVQPVLADGQRPDGLPVIAVDKLGAGPGERVVLTSDGATIREQYGVENSPIRWSTLALADPI